MPTVTREQLAGFPWRREGYQPVGRRYWPAGSGSWLSFRSATDSLAHRFRRPAHITANSAQLHQGPLLPSQSLTIRACRDP